MNYKQLQRRVEVAERRVDSRGEQTREHWAALKLNWREGWTPARIIGAGLVSGFISGRAEPLRALSGPRLLQMIGAVSGLFASMQATVAAETAQDAATTAEDVAADQALGDATPSDSLAQSPAATSAPHATPDTVYSTQPSPAEAATDMSER